MSEQWTVRWGAIEALAEKWPDESTRKLLAERAVQDEHQQARRAALQVLAEKWPDETTRKLFAERAVQDVHEEPRRTALQTLAEKWPDETTRKLLAERAVQDEHEGLRRTALQTLAEKWPDETTRKLLAERASVDGVAASRFGGWHSEFGRLVFTRDLDGMAPYLDPASPSPASTSSERRKRPTCRPTGSTRRFIRYRLTWAGTSRRVRWDNRIAHITRTIDDIVDDV